MLKIKELYYLDFSLLLTDLAHECAAQEMRFYHGEVRDEAEDAIEDEAPVRRKFKNISRSSFFSVVSGWAVNTEHLVCC